MGCAVLVGVLVEDGNNDTDCVAVDVIELVAVLAVAVVVRLPVAVRGTD